MLRQLVTGVVVLQFLAAIFLLYPVWRISSWLGAPDVLVWVVSLTAFFSQLVVRFVLRRVRGRWVRALRAAADFVLGIAPVMLILTLCGELVLANTGIAYLWVGLGVFVGSLLAGVWGVAKAWVPELVTVRLQSAKLAQAVRFVQLSDVHIGSRSSRFLKQLVDRVNDLQPDFLCITGDFIDERGIDEARLAALREVCVPIYFCSGNHEHYEDFDEIIARLQRLGVQVLRGRTIQHEALQVIGFDDNSNPDFLRDALPTLQLRDDLFSLLLFHRPLGLEHAAANGIDLQISGHTHNGQIVPFQWLVRLQFKHLKGLHRHGNTHLYVNEGTGTWGPTMRLGTRSEITLFEISHLTG